ncbi:MAG: GGDEF domain-containing protein [Cognaticolwellia sp.]
MPQSIDFYSETLSKWTCEFQNREQENDFLASKLQADKRVARFLVCVVACVLLLLLFVDRFIIKPEFWPTIALVWRGGFVVSCLVVAFAIRYVNTVRQLQLFTQCFVIYMFLNVQAMVITYDDSYVLHVFFDIIILVAIYFSTLFPFKVSCLFGLLYGALGIAMVLQTKTVSFHSFSVVIMAYIAVNLVGIVISAQEHLLKRRLYYRNERLKALALEMKSQAYKDSLTQIPNRRAFDENYQRYQSTAQRLVGETDSVCVAVCDIDFFKRVNDTFGHDVGDLVLIEFAQFLLKSVRPTDGVYRFGGEEFVIVLTNCCKADAINRIHKIISDLTNSVLDIEEIGYPITASFGLAILQPKEDQKTVIARADMALYQAKDTGRNKLCVDETIT